LRYFLYQNGDLCSSSGIGGNMDFCKEIAKNKRSYTISKSDYRTIVSSAILLAQRKVYKLVFLTATFPVVVSEKEGNVAITRFISTIKRKYDVREYIWTKELQSNKEKRLHYHLIIDLPFIPIKDLQADWNNSVRFATKFDGVMLNNSLRLPPRTVHFNKMDAIAVAKYMAKYISKERTIEYEKPCWSFSRGIRDVRREINGQECIELVKKRGFIAAYGNKYFGITMLKNEVSTKKERK